MAAKPDAVIIPDAESITNQRRNVEQLNFTLFSTSLVVVIFIILALMWGNEYLSENNEEISEQKWNEVPLKERYKMGWKKEI